MAPLVYCGIGQAKPRRTLGEEATYLHVLQLCGAMNTLTYRHHMSCCASMGTDMHLECLAVGEWLYGCTRLASARNALFTSFNLDT